MHVKTKDLRTRAVSDNTFVESVAGAEYYMSKSELWMNKVIVLSRTGRPRQQQDVFVFTVIFSQPSSVNTDNGAVSHWKQATANHTLCIELACIICDAAARDILFTCLPEALRLRLSFGILCAKLKLSGNHPQGAGRVLERPHILW